MGSRKINILLTIHFILLFAGFPLLADAQKNPLVEAIQKFDEDNYTEAESLLKSLIDEKPDNLMINYYYGACRTENGHYGNEEIKYLLKGSMGESPLKTDYYLAVQYHALQQWDNALKYYLKYQKTANKAEQEILGLTEKIQQCKEQTSLFVVENNDVAPIPLTRIDTAENKPDTVNYMVETDSVTTDTIVTEVFANTSNSTPTVKSEAVPINFDINSKMTYVDTSNFQTPDGLHSYVKWKELKHNLDLLTQNLDDWRQKYAAAKTTSLKTELGQKIVEAEGNLFALQKDTRESLQAAQKLETEFWNSRPEQEQLDFIAHLQELASSGNQQKPAVAEIIDTALIVPSEAYANTVQPEPQQTDEQTDELVYKIQIGAYSRGLPPYVKKQFDKLAFIRKIDQYTDEKGVVVYTTGNLTNYEDAQKMQTQVRREGIEDAFVVPYFNGKRITLSEAKKMEADQ
ncbi:MAG: hypothetical protein ACK5M7_16850 [Draconibacterium sp.]